MNLHDITPNQKQYVIAAVDDEDAPNYNPCEWGTWNLGEECDKTITKAIVDTSQNQEHPYHGIPGWCIGHLCDDHIDAAFRETTKPPV